MESPKEITFVGEMDVEFILDGETRQGVMIECSDILNYDISTKQEIPTKYFTFLIELKEKVQKFSGMKSIFLFGRENKVIFHEKGYLIEVFSRNKSFLGGE